MKTERLTNSPSFKASLRINSITKAIAISGLAIGAAAMLPVAPAGAVLLSTGTLAFTDGTADFFSSPAQTSYTVNFNPSGTARIETANGAFGSTFGANENRTITPSTGIFNLVSGTTFSLASPALNFTFPTSNGTIVSIAPGSTFTRTVNNDNGVGFANLDVTGTVSNPDGTVNLQQVAFTFSDIIGVGGATYGIGISPVNPVAAVPEPFTVIGSLVGGAAALRMRKKLANATKN
jgi:hypothetical protein